MDLFRIGFITVTLMDILDILLVTFLIYKLYEVLRGTLAIRAASLVLAIFLLWKFFDLLQFRLMRSILGQLINLGALILVVIFAPEIRRFFTIVSKNTFIDRIVKQMTVSEENTEVSEEITLALKDLRAAGHGALIVLTGNNDLDEIVETGDVMDAEISTKLLVAIFQKESPLHDGAVIIRQNRIAAVRCILPMTPRQDLDRDLGTRHRAAIGITENTDALVIVVSEERRELSLALEGQLNRNVDYAEVKSAVQSHLGSVAVLNSSP